MAQKAVLSGKVTESGKTEPVIGASISINDKPIGVTDFDGNYQAELDAGSYKIEFSYTGFEKVMKEVTLAAGEQKTVDVAMGDSPSMLNQLVVSGNRFEKPLSEQTVSLEVIKPDLIERSASPSVDKVLEKVPGVNIIDGQANIRGGSGWSYGAGSRVLLLVNDMPILQADAGYPNWNDVPVENIEQVEVIKGAASALYGSSALNGVINVRTAYAKRDQPVTKFALFQTGYMNPKDEAKMWWKDRPAPYERGVNLAHRHNFGKFDLVAGVNFTDKRGFRRGENNTFGRVTALTRYRITDELSVGVNFNFNKGNSKSFFLWNGDSTGAYLPIAPLGGEEVLTATKMMRYSIDPFVNYLDKFGNQHKLLGRYFHVNNDNNNNQGNTSDFLYGEYQFQRKWKSIDLVSSAGVVASGNKANAELYGNAVLTSQNLATYLQLDKKLFDKLNLSFGARYELNQLTNPLILDSLRLKTGFYSKVDTIAARTLREGKPVFRVGANYELGKATFLRASWGQGYRYPTVAEKFIQTQISILGIFANPDLQSETGWSGELGLKQGFKVSDWKGFLDVSAFYTAYQNMMEFTFGGNDPNNPLPGFQSLNVGDTYVPGFDATIAGQGKIFGNSTTILAGYTYINPKFSDFNARQDSLSSVDYNVLKYRFKHTVKLDIETQFFDKYSVGVALNYFSKMEAVDGIFEGKGSSGAALIGPILAPDVRRFRSTHGGAPVWDIRAAYTPNEHARLSFLVRNILNTEYSLRPALLEAPRNFTVRLDYTF